MRQVKLRLANHRVLNPPQSINELLGSIWKGRGLSSEPNYAMAGLLPPTLSGLSIAVDRLLKALDSQESVLVVGDFDADGATATALAVSALESFGFKAVDWVIPDRFTHGYGLTPALIDELPRPLPSLLLTVDQGISSLEGVAYANSLGMDVIVTDHHLPGATLPDAVAIVNPNLPDDPFPSKALSGVGVLFYLMVALRQSIRQRGGFEGMPEPRLDQWLDLVALGTVADLVPLDDNNRLIVAQGIRRIQAGQVRPGIRALLEKAGKNIKHITASDLGFAVAPRLNAAGRLEAMAEGVACLMAQSEDVARQHADVLDNINIERKALQQSMQEEAYAQTESLLSGMDESLAGACLYEEHWHQGVVGLVAGRVAEHIQRPVIAFAPESAGSDSLKGSGRSPSAIHMRDLLVTIDRSEPGLISRFGGHAGAAGLSLPKSSLPQFREVFLQCVKAIPSEDPEIASDGPLPEALLSVETASALAQAGPWGQGFPEPLFDGQFSVLDRRVVGGSHLKLKLQPVGSRRSIDAIAFRAGHLAHMTLPNPWHVTYRLEVNRFRGQSTVQLNLQHWVQ